MVLAVAAVLLPASETDSAVITDVHYIDVDGVEVSTDDLFTPPSVTELFQADFAATPYELTSGWYIVAENITLGDNLTITGDVNLIIGDGFKLEMTANLTNGSIHVLTGSSLSVYSQPVTVSKGEIVATTGNCIHLDGGSFTNTASISATAADRCGVIGGLSTPTPTILNGSTGSISGDPGISIYNATITNNAGGLIHGEGNGITLNNEGEIFNYGTIESTVSGSYAIKASYADVTNSGMINGNMGGVRLDDGGRVDNTGGTIQGKWYGVILLDSAEIINSGTITATDSDGDGIYLMGGSIPVTLTNSGTINGRVELRNVVNTVTFEAGGVINGNFTMGTGASTLYFTGTLGPTLSPADLTCAAVNGAASLGSGTTKVDISGLTLPAGYSGETVILINVSGTMTGSPSNKMAPFGTGLMVIGTSTHVLAATPSLVDVYYMETDGTSALQSNVFEVYEDFFTLSYTISSGGANDGWYIIKEDITLTSLSITGNVRIIIGAGCTLNVTNGVTVGSGSTFSLYTEDPSISSTGTVNGILYVANNNSVALADGTFTNTAAIVSASGNGVISSNDATIINGVTGSIEGLTGIKAARLDYGNYEITNYGTITGNTEKGIVVSDGDRPFIDNYGIIYGEDTGIVFEQYLEYARVDNSNNGEITGNTGEGIWFKDDGGFVINNYHATAFIGGLGNGIIADNTDCFGEINNYGDIQGTNGYGVFVNGLAYIYNDGAIYGNSGIYIAFLDSSSGYSVENTGSISGRTLNGITVADGTDIYIYNNGGTISAVDIAVYLYAYGVIYNDGAISLAAVGIDLPAGGEVFNFGSIAGTTNGIIAADTVIFANDGIVNGNVSLNGTANDLTLYEGSSVTGDLTIGSGSSLFFMGILGTPPVFSTVGGNTDIGDAAVDIDPAALPAGLVPGDKIVLIDGSTGTMTGTPANPTMSLGGYDFRIQIVGDQLVATVYIPIKYYYVTPTADGGSTISPAVKTQAEAHSSLKFTFAAREGFYVSSVLVDGVALSEAEILLGYYTFTNIMMNHHIDVKSTPGQRLADIELSITVTGNGKAQYSTDNTTFIDYVVPVNFKSGTTLYLTAVPDEGNKLSEWKIGSTTYNNLDVVLSNRTSSVNAELSFTGEGGNSNLMWIIILIVIILVVLLILFLIFRRRGQSK